MHDPKQSLILIRKELETYLREWIPNNRTLVKKELSIFDKIVSRRDFLKTSSLAALMALVHQGCQKNGPPSQWDENSQNDDGPITQVDISSVQTPANIVADSDMHSSFVTHNPLGAYGSSDSTDVQDHTIMESFNPHIMTANTVEDLEDIGLNIPKRTYGIAEHVHLVKNDTNNTYHLAIYEKSNHGHHGLHETVVNLDGTEAQNFNTLIATNGTFHNRIVANKVYSQKMALLANVSAVSINLADTNHKSLLLYYQAQSSELLQPSVELLQNPGWDSIDILEEFKNTQEYPFENYCVIEAKSYHDGEHHSFIYGTVRFDKFYTYGFVITFNNASDTKPSVTFFAPEFMSCESEFMQEIFDGYKSIEDNGYSADSLENLAIFSENTFKPFVQIVDTNGSPQYEVYFSFVSFNITDSSGNGYLQADNYNFYFDDFSSLSEPFIKRYLIKVDTSKKLEYVLAGYKPEVSFTTNDSDQSLEFVFDTSSIETVDLWDSFYNRQVNQLESTFARFIKMNNETLEATFASSYYDETKFEMGISHKYVEVDIKSKKISVHTANTPFENGSHQSQNYKNLWFDDMRAHLNSVDSLYECAFHNQGMQSVDFHSTHNHQGLLRSYFIIRHVNSDYTVNSYLIGFNEKGDESTGKLAHQTHNTLKEQIINNITPHYPPMPVAINPYTLHPWHGVSEDGEVLYSSTRQYKIDLESKSLVVNEDIGLLSYMHSSCDTIQKSWNMHEEQSHVSSVDEKIHTHTVKRDLHQIHLQVTNVYRDPVSLHKSDYSFSKLSKDAIEQIKQAQPNRDIYVEVRFNKRLSIKDYTDPANPKTYHPGTNNSIFLATDSSGKIALEVDAGNKDDQYNGAIIEYRIVDKKQLSQQNNTSLYTLNSSGSTTDFKSFHISFRMFQRLSTANEDISEIGAPKNHKVVDILKNNINDYAAIETIATGYSALYASDGIAPRNSDPLLLFSRSVRQRSRSSIFLRSWESATYFNSSHWISQAARTAFSLAENAILAAKKALEALVSDLGDIVNSIGSDVMGAIEAMAAAIEKLWDEAESFAKKLWDALRAFLDLQTAFDIGQELKQLRYDQLKPLEDGSSKNSGEHNIFTFLEEAETQLSYDMQKLTSQAHSSLEKVFSLDLDEMAKHQNTAKNDKSVLQDNSTKFMHIFDQISRLVHMLDVFKEYVEEGMDEFMSALFGVTLTDIEDGEFARYAQESILNFLGVDSIEDLAKTFTYYDGLSEGDDPDPNNANLIRQIKNTAMGVEDQIKAFASGLATADEIKENIKISMKSILDYMIKDIGAFVAFALKAPIVFLKDDKVLSCMTQSGPLLRKLLDPLGAVLFLDKEKFKNLEDVATFFVGFHINIAPLAIKTVYKNISDEFTKQTAQELDLSSLITNGTLRENINKYANNLDLSNYSNGGTVSSQGILQNTLEEYSLKIVILLLDAIAAIASAIHAIISLSQHINALKDPIADTVMGTINLIIGFVRLFQIVPYTMKILSMDDKSTIEQVDIVAQSIASIIACIVDFIQNLNEADAVFWQGQQGEVIAYDPTRIVLVSQIFYILSINAAFIVKTIAFGLHIKEYVARGFPDDMLELSKDYLIGFGLELELSILFVNALSILVDTLSRVTSYIVKSIDIEVVVAAVETVVAPIAYGVARVAVIVLDVDNKVIGGIQSVLVVTLSIENIVQESIE